MNRSPTFALAVAGLLALPTFSRADLLLHATLDNVDIGNRDNLGCETTANGPFAVFDTAGPTLEDGTAAGFDTALANPGATATIHVSGGVTGQIGQALNFGTYTGTNAENGGVSFGDVLDVGTGNYTVSLWYFQTSTVGSQFLVSKGNAGSTEAGFGVFTEVVSGTTFLRLRVGTSAANRASQSFVTTANVWHHLALTIDNTTGTVLGYFDGTNSGAINGGGGPTVNTFTPGTDFSNMFALTLGISRTAASEFKGNLDDLGIYNEALSAAQINQIYQNGLVGIAVPEPSSALLSLGGVSALALRRRRVA